MSYLKEMAEQGYNSDTIGAFHRVMMPYLARRLGIGKADAIIDIGAGQGHGLIPLKNAGYGNLHALDIDPMNFELFKTRFGIEGHVCDANRDRFPFADDQIAFAYSAHVIEHLDQPGHFLSEIYRVLKPGAHVALVTPDWRKQFKTFYRDPTHIRPYDKVSIGRLLRMHGFRDVETSSWNARFGLGRLQAYRWFPKAGMIGEDMIAFAVK